MSDHQTDARERLRAYRKSLNRQTAIRAAIPVAIALSAFIAVKIFGK